MTIKHSFLLGFLLSIMIGLGIVFFPQHAPKDKGEKEKMTLLEAGFSPGMGNPKVTNFDVVFYEKEGEGFKKTTRQLSDFSGKTVVLHFWATWCKPCVHELPYYDAFSKNTKNVVHLPVVSDGASPEAIEKFFKDLNIKHLPIVVDTTKGLSLRFGLTAVPATILINKNGREVGRAIGAIDWTQDELPELFEKMT